MSYDLVSITNSTEFVATGHVKYVSYLCSDDDYTVTPHTTWTASSRGVCLLSEISAVVKTPNGDIAAKPYTSAGTTYSQFAIVRTGPASFTVTRLVSGAEDLPPEDYVEPTSPQK